MVLHLDQKTHVSDKARTPGGKVGLIVRTTLALLATLSSIALAWSFVLSDSNALAYGINEYPTTVNPWGLAFDYKHGYVWVAEPACDSSPVCSTPPPGRIGRYTMANPAAGEKDFAAPRTQYNPVFVAVDRNGNVWFTDPTHNKIGELLPKSNAWVAWQVPTANAAPYDLIIDRNGNIWFSEILANKIGFFNPSTHKFVENAIPSASSTPYGIALSDNGFIWFAENNQHKLGRFKPTISGLLGKGAITEHIVSKNASPHLLTFDAAGNVWYSEGFAGRIGKYNPKSNSFNEYNVTLGACPSPTATATPGSCPGIHISGISVDSHGLVWFDDSLSARIGNLNPGTGVVTVLHLGFLGAHPHDGLGIDKSNNLWFTEQFGYRLSEVMGA